jgi:hypothetical protein
LEDKKNLQMGSFSFELIQLEQQHTLQAPRMYATEQTGMMGMEMRKQREKKTLSTGRNNKQTDGCKQKRERKRRKRKVKNLTERCQIDFEMASSLVIHIAHTDGNPRLPSCADEAIASGISGLEALDNLLHILVMLILSLFLGLGGGPNVPPVCPQVERLGHWQHHKNDQNPSELHCPVHPRFGLLLSQRLLQVRHRFSRARPPAAAIDFVREMEEKA